MFIICHIKIQIQIKMYPKNSIIKHYLNQRRIASLRQKFMGSNNQRVQILQGLHLKPKLSILHFNDVYDIQTKKGIGGVCNFKAKLEEFRQIYGQNCLVLFSGDAFSPSILSRNKKGWQMIKALNSLKIDFACYGNHEFDFEEEHTIKLAQACNFPWLLGNIRNIKTKRVLGNGIPYVIKTMPNGLKVGIFGVAGEDWISIMSEEYEGLFQCEDVEQYCMRMSKILKHDQKCDFIVALTHMRNGDDLDMAQVPSDIDIILGGHDHVVMNRCIQNIPVIKSGSNFHQLGVVQVYEKIPQLQNSQNLQGSELIKHQHQRRLYLGKHFNFSCQIHEVPVASPQKIDAQLKAYVDQEMQQYKKVDRIVGYTQCPLEARFRVIRTAESNYGNFFADLFRNYYGSDLSLVNSGSIRNDAILPEGNIKYSKMSNVIEDKIIVKLLPGSAIIKMLEYAIKGLPHSFMGSFLLVSGIKYTYDLTKTPRIQSVIWNGEPLNTNRQYTVAMPSYMGNGADGYDFVKQYRKIVDQVRAISTLTVLSLFFEGLDDKKEEHDTHHDNHYHPKRSLANRVERIKSLRSKFLVTQNGQKLVCIEPKIDSRILCINEQVN